MKTLILTLFALLVFGCSAEVAPTESIASTEQAVCSGPAGLQALGLVLTPTAVQRANLLVNKMWGTWPKAPPGCPGAWYCPYIPSSCTPAQCAAGSCFGWTCQQTDIAYASDGLRLSTVVAGLSLVDNKFALQPEAGGLTALETTELGVARAAGVVLSDFWGCQ
jgi:hypothetical protein